MKYQVEKLEHGSKKVFIRAKELVARCENLDALADEWLQAPGDKIIFTTGMDDEGKHNLVAVILHAQGRDSAVLYIPLAQIHQLYGDLRGLVPSSTMLRPFDEEQHESVERIFRARDKKLGARSDEHLCFPVFSREHLLNLCLSYAVENLGEAEVQLVGEGSLDEWEVPAPYFRNQKIAALSASMKNPQNGVAVHEDCFVVWE